MILASKKTQNFVQNPAQNPMAMDAGSSEHGAKKRQRRSLIVAWGIAPGPPAEIDEGLKARPTANPDWHDWRYGSPP